MLWRTAPIRGITIVAISPQRHSAMGGYCVRLLVSESIIYGEPGVGGERGALIEFCMRLAQLHREAGRPTVASLCRRRDFPLRKTQVYDVLGGRIRRPPSWEFVRTFVAACAEYAHRNGHTLSLSASEAQWRHEYDFVVRTDDVQRRDAQPGPADTAQMAKQLQDRLNAVLYRWTADDVAAGLAAAPPGTPPALGSDDRVDVALLRGGRLPGLQAAYGQLATRFREWLASPAGAEVAALCIVGEPDQHRSMALLACLSNAGGAGYDVWDAGTDLDALNRGLEILLIPPTAAPPLIVAVEIADTLEGDAWPDLGNTLAHARKLATRGAAWGPRLVIAATAAQYAAGTGALHGLVEAVRLGTDGRPYAPSAYRIAEILDGAAEASRAVARRRPALPRGGSLRVRPSDSHALIRHAGSAVPTSSPALPATSPALSRTGPALPATSRALPTTSPALPATSSAVPAPRPATGRAAPSGSADPATLRALGEYLLAQGLNRLSQLERGEAAEHGWEAARRCLDEAVELLRAAGHPVDLVRALVARARFWRGRREPGDAARAAVDLDEAEAAPAGRGQLIHTDLLLERLAHRLAFPGLSAGGSPPTWVGGAGPADPAAPYSLTEVDGLIRALAQGRRMAMLAIRRRSAA
jgi:hypothetical protein